MKSQIGQWGNSLALRIPKIMAEELDLKLNDAVQCRIENGKLVVEPVIIVKKYTLDELLAEDIEPSDEISWGKPEGDEVW